MIELIISIALIGFLLWLITTFIPMPAQFQTGIYALGGILVLLMILSALGIVHLGGVVGLGFHCS